MNRIKILILVGLLLQIACKTTSKTNSPLPSIIPDYSLISTKEDIIYQDSNDTVDSISIRTSPIRFTNRPVMTLNIGKERNKDGTLATEFNNQYITPDVPYYIMFDTLGNLKFVPVKAEIKPTEYNIEANTGTSNQLLLTINGIQPVAINIVDTLEQDVVFQEGKHDGQSYLTINKDFFGKSYSPSSWSYVIPPEANAEMCDYCIRVKYDSNVLLIKPNGAIIYNNRILGTDFNLYLNLIKTFDKQY